MNFISTEILDCDKDLVAYVGCPAVLDKPDLKVIGLGL